ncbi:MAG: hypothetical protein VCD00_10975 [Candidatus Hydrogenedentota bacterium]
MKALLKMSVLALSMVVLTGCASTGGGASDEDVVNGIVAEMMAALAGQDIDKMVSFYSEDFESDQGGDRDATREFLAGAKEQGFLDGIEVDQSSSETSIEGDKASVGPIDLEGAFGALTLEFDLEKRDGSWIVVYMAQY